MCSVSHDAATGVVRVVFHCVGCGCRLTVTVMKPMRLAAGLAAVVAIAVSGCAANSPNAEAPQRQAGAPDTGDCATGRGAAGTCVIGDTGPGGGKVFYVNPTNTPGSNYMEAPPNTWSGGSEDPSLAWDPAVSAAKNYNGGSLKNWVLPSKDQLNALYTQQATVGGLAVGWYWSSSQSDASNAWFQIVGNGGGPAWQYTGNKSYANRVRPVRAF